MKSFKIQNIHTLSLILLLFSNFSLAQNNTTQSFPKPENNISKPSVFSAYYNMHINNKSKTANVNIIRKTYTCMYEPGPENISLPPQNKRDFRLEDDDNVLHHCNREKKIETWTIEYIKPDSEKTTCSATLLTKPAGGIFAGWLTYLTPEKGTECDVPVKFICDGNTAHCRDGFSSHDGAQFTMEITN
ncbi:hypothetical protein Xsto_01933 [Xenorhabdus stockiae]|uniref:Uncharacterized protein n=1 Tax=Xenorhabdus stockiae TaxID=351614 RepID=A0A2D0KQK0_9GAMM|nr:MULTISPECIES: hypothetical protein [Xenorhabdus]PHM65575.1 hypothetical protein Xsto_01933 [Xenorhabdus stockiae]PHM68604.1 hypothetical protein Xekj_03141 [Xenorhabdus sp. KJ12.1]